MTEPQAHTDEELDWYAAEEMPAIDEDREDVFEDAERFSNGDVERFKDEAGQ